MARYFNTAGPNKADLNYTIDPLSRFDLDELLFLIEQQKYFVLHAPRQTGKTSCMLALRDHLNKSGKYVAVYANVENGQSAINDVGRAVGAVCNEIAVRFKDILKSDVPVQILKSLKDTEPDSKLNLFLRQLTGFCSLPVVLFLDEIDALVGDSLVSVLRQLRSGYDDRPDSFTQSIILCGVRDVRYYRIVLSNQDIITGRSVFNIQAKSLRIGDFSIEEIRELYNQHTEETGQKFEKECFPLIWTATEGQPWLVNAIGHEVTYEMKENRDRSVTIIPEMVEKAIESIIYRRDTHIDILIDKLKEERVRRVIEPLLAGKDEVEDNLIPEDDIRYVQDLGLIKIERGKTRRISNAIYKEIIPRELTWTTQDGITQDPVWYIKEDGRIDMTKMLLNFQQFFRENSDSWIGKFDYAEAGPQLLLQAFLQRIVNGGGYIDREYGLGRKRTDLLVRKPLTKGYGGPVQRVVLELKIKRGDLDKVIEEGLRQTSEYMDICGSVDEGHLIIFDRDGMKSWDERIWHKPYQFGDKKIIVWGM